MISFTDWAQQGQQKGYIEKFLNSVKKKRQINSYKEWLEIGKKQGYIPELTNQLENKFEDYLGQGNRRSQYERLGKKQQKQFRTAFYNTAFSKNPAGIVNFVKNAGRKDFDYARYLEDRIKYSQGIATSTLINAFIIQPLEVEMEKAQDPYIDEQCEAIIAYVSSNRVKFTIANMIKDILYKGIGIQEKIDAINNLLGIA